jgi:hypothetical protein
MKGPPPASEAGTAGSPERVEDASVRAVRSPRRRAGFSTHVVEEEQREAAAAPADLPKDPFLGRGRPWTQKNPGRIRPGFFLLWG